MGDFAGIPWGKQGQCCLTPRYSLGDFAEILFPGVHQVGDFARSVLSNAKWEILQVFPPSIKQGQCCLTSSGRFYRYSLGKKVSVV